MSHCSDRGYLVCVCAVPITLFRAHHHEIRNFVNFFQGDDTFCSIYTLSSFTLSAARAHQVPKRFRPLWPTHTLEPVSACVLFRASNFKHFENFEKFLAQRNSLDAWTEFSDENLLDRASSACRSWCVVGSLSISFALSIWRSRYERLDSNVSRLSMVDGI